MRANLLNSNFYLYFSLAWMQQQNYLQFPDIKQEPISPHYDMACSSITPPPPQRYTPSPNMLHANSFTPNIPIQGVSQQPHYEMVGYIPSVSPLQQTNILNQPYQSPPNQNHNPNPNQINIQNIMGNAGINFLNNNNNNNNNNNHNQNLNNQTEQRNLGDVLTNNLDNINCLNNVTSTTNEDNAMESVSMNISSLLDLDSQQQINTSDLIMSTDMLNDIMKNLANEGNGANQTPLNVNVMQTNNIDAAADEEENMTDSFKQFSIE